VRRSLWQFGLLGTYSEACVLNEAYVRGCRSIAEGKRIKNTSSWLKGASYNIIREWSREQRRTTPLQEDHVEGVQELVRSEALEDDLETLQIAFQCLPDKDQLLLNLKIGYGLSWKEVQEALKVVEKREVSETSLRKKKERALIKLRKKFHAIKPLF
jgi:DNA-directed RNA polymerase specialized sigma24 family protein